MLKSFIHFFTNISWKPTYVSGTAMGIIRDEIINEKDTVPALMKLTF